MWRLTRLCRVTVSERRILFAADARKLRKAIQQLNTFLETGSFIAHPDKTQIRCLKKVLTGRVNGLLRKACDRHRGPFGTTVSAACGFKSSQDAEAS